MTNYVRQPAAGWICDFLRHQPKLTATRQQVLEAAPYSEAALDAAAFVMTDAYDLLALGETPGAVCGECGHRKRSSRTWQLRAGNRATERMLGAT